MSSKALVAAVIVWFTIHLVQAQDKQTIEWKTWNALEEALRKEPKPVMLFFEAEWCAYCKKINREVFTRDQIINKLNTDYYALRMDVECRDTIVFDGATFTNEQAATQRNGVHQLALIFAARRGEVFSLPATIILDKEFKVKKRVFEYYTSAQLIGFL